MKRWIAMFALVALSLLPGLTGCKTIERRGVRGTVDMLDAVGFSEWPASTPEQSDALRRMEPRKFKIVVKNGKTWYVYPDTTYCNCLYAGTETEYQSYKRLALERQIAREKLEAAEDREFDQMNWETWGPWL